MKCSQRSHRDNMIKTRNPSTGDLLPSVAFATTAMMHETMMRSQTAFLQWRRTDIAVRANLLRRLAALLREQKPLHAVRMATEMGKPVTAGEAEIEKCAFLCEHYASEGAAYLAPRSVQTETVTGTVYSLPLGLVFAIMPWNFPYWQVFRFAVPALMAGNVALLKHAPITAGCGQAIAELFLESGFPEGVFQHLVLSDEQAAEVIAHEHTAAVTFTGSARGGSAVAATAGRFLKKVVLELGGSDPYVILEDADLKLAARAVVTSRLSNSGQVCIAAKRVIAPESIADALLLHIRQEMSEWRTGDPLHPSTRMGPLAREDLRDTVHHQVQRAVAAGATLIEGGTLPTGPGFFYPPTLLDNVQPLSPVFEEEVFGPVIALVRAEDNDACVSLANQSHFGLGAAVFTRNLKRGEAIALHEIESGVCYVNAMVASDPRLPFGGIRHSGFGRELSREGILEFVNIKTVGVHAG